MATIQILKEKMKLFLTRKRIKYFFASILLISVLVGGYCFYNYYKFQFVDSAIVLVRFKQGVTEEEAFKMLEKYEKGISSRIPRDYDDSAYAPLEGFKARTIQLTVKGAYNWNAKVGQIKNEPIVELASKAKKSIRYE